MHYIFISVWVLVATFFFCRRRDAGLTLLAFVGVSYYFSPGLLGFVTVPLAGHHSLETGLVAREDIYGATYIVMSIVTLAVGVAGFVYVVMRRKAPLPYVPPLHNRYIVVALIGCCIGFVWMLYSTGFAVFTLEKSEIEGSINNRGYVLWTVLSGLGFVTCCSARRWRYAGVFAAFICVDIFIGYRVTAVMAVLGASVLLYDQGLLRRWMLIGAACFMVSLLLYKQSGAAIKSGRWDIVGENFSSPEYYSRSLLESEPIVIQAILNQALVDNKMYSPTPFWFYITQFVPFTNNLGARYDVLNAFNGNAVFSGVQYGLASNPWAEMLFTVGIGGFAIGVAMYAVLVVVVSRAYLLARTHEAKAFVVVNAALLCFYFHRNVLIYQLNLHRQIIYAYVMLLCVAWLFTPKAKRAARRCDRHRNVVRGDDHHYYIYDNTL